MNSQPNLNRRDFLKISAGAGLLIGIYLSGCRREPDDPLEAYTPISPTATADYSKFQPSAFLRIDTSGEITVVVSKPELGQGVRTTLPMIIAEELGAAWESIQVEQATADRIYGNQVVKGSQSISDLYPVLRQAGVLARGLLLAAAAQIWNVSPEVCSVANGWVTDKSSDRKLSFGELASTAATVERPVESHPLDSGDYRIIGTSVQRVDDAMITNGSALFGIDVVLPGMLYAVVARSPFPGGKVLEYDQTLSDLVPGIRHILQIEDKVAVVADNTWAAIRGRQGLEITWSQGEATHTDSESPKFKTTKTKYAGDITKREQGSPARLAALVPAESSVETQQEGTWLEAVYEVPHFAHVSMEPMNCTADIRENSGEIWAPTQDPMKAVVLKAAGLENQPENLKVHIPLVGGSFGRRLEVDYVIEAVQISKAVGAPVKVIWTRDDDIQHDYFHPGSMIEARSSLDRPMMPNITVTPRQTPLRTGTWRSAQNFDEAFARECFLDEYAEALERDPVDLRLELYQDARMKAVLEKAAAESGWSGSIRTGLGRGVACHATWDSTPVAQVAEVSLNLDGSIRVERIICALDPGLVIHPDIVVQQIEGGIAFALSAVLKNEITHLDGQVQQTNFENYPILRFREMPVVEVHILPSEREPSGVGAMGVPPLAPAVCNALYALTGQRIRKLPIRMEQA